MKITKNSIIMPRWNDCHLHLRAGNMLKTVLPYSEDICNHALIMGNAPKITTAECLTRYTNEILTARHQKIFEPHIAFYITQETTYEDIQRIKRAGSIAGKLYLQSKIGQETTTGSESGIYTLSDAYPQCEALQDLDMILAIHAEVPSAFCLDREIAIIPQIQCLIKNFPRLRISIEHVSDERMINFVLSQPHTSNVRGTITAHHPYLTLDDVIGGKLNTHNFCKPIAKRPHDRDAIIRAMLNSYQSQRFSFGSDSAPHTRRDKECAEGCAGVFTAHAVPSLLIELFEKHSALYYLEDFVVKNSAETHGFISDESDMIEFIREPWKVPCVIPMESGNNTIVPFFSGKEMKWQLAK